MRKRWKTCRLAFAGIYCPQLSLNDCLCTQCWWSGTDRAQCDPSISGAMAEKKVGAMVMHCSASMGKFHQASFSFAFVCFASSKVFGASRTWWFVFASLFPTTCHGQCSGSSTKMRHRLFLEDFMLSFHVRTRLMSLRRS